MISRRSILIGAVIIIIGTIAYLQREQMMSPFSGSGAEVVSDIEVDAKEGRFIRAKELTAIASYINAEPFTLSEYIGKKVILIDFWTYSCINCQRTFPYLKEWWERYEDDGLLIVGVHTPEFDFEHDEQNVRTAVEKFGIRYPVVLDNDYGTWQAYRNQYWPRKYLIDADGYIVYDHIGEGGYEETEEKIKDALRELMQKQGIAGDLEEGVAIPVGVDAVEYGKVRSPEIYFGALRNDTFFGNGKSARVGEQVLVLPERIDPNLFYLDGTWGITEEYAQSQTTQTRLVFRYSAKNVNIVAGSQAPILVTVLRDGKPIGTAAGTDLVNGSVTIQGETLYNIVNDPSGYGEHTLELLIESPGLQIYAFTFG